MQKCLFGAALQRDISKRNHFVRYRERCMTMSLLCLLSSAGQSDRRDQVAAPAGHFFLNRLVSPELSAKRAL
jgi:hypothetical protein